ncbi:COMPASS component SWD2 [Fistulifera solaris]|uniref:COMPASS component SWD2 n=1 Tax=Fistulifera solaris TaxID=1519565 RepID=A0A1Z5K1M4_FISSO|nr:COMPASS component SWD2 [Fistulifera solaris]|eukprot:GAX19918.1 COMPASS component SWD2 [Fistulifera solaris]
MDFSLPSAPAVGAVIPSRYEATSMCYHENGKRLFVAYEAGSLLQAIDCMSGSAAKPALKCEDERIHCLEATHHEECVLIAGKGSPTVPSNQRSAITYWSLYDNKILRKFRGHTDQITKISMNPADDTFLSSSKDRTVRLWSAQSAGSLAELKLPGDRTSKDPLAAFDCTGLVFAVTAKMAENQGQYLHLYDARNYGVGAFAELKIKRDDIEKALQSFVSVSPDQLATFSHADFTSLQFNTSGNKILAGTDRGMSFVMDGFEGTIQGVFVSTSQRPAVSCFSSDDKTIMVGNEDGSITCWDVETGSMVKRLDGHPDPVQCIASNPKFAQFASASTQTALWTW